MSELDTSDGTAGHYMSATMLNIDPVFCSVKVDFLLSRLNILKEAVEGIGSPASQLGKNLSH